MASSFWQNITLSYVNKFSKGIIVLINIPIKIASTYDKIITLTIQQMKNDKLMVMNVVKLSNIRV